MEKKRSRGRPPKKPLAVDILIESAQRNFGAAAQERTNVYRRLVRATGLKDRTIREAFAGLASDDTRSRIECALALPKGSLRKERLDLDLIFSQLKDYRDLVSQRMRHMDEQKIKAVMPTMMSISSLLSQIVEFTTTNELTPHRKLVVFETLHENLAYRHLAFDDLAEERSIQELVRIALPAAIQLRLCKRLNDDQLAGLDASIGELWTNSTLPFGDVWKRDSVSTKAAVHDATQHLNAEACFRSASLFTSKAASYYHWRQYLSIEARARIYAKSRMVEKANEELVLVSSHLAGQTLDIAMEGDLLLVKGMVANAAMQKNETIDFLERAHNCYASAHGHDHHLTHALSIYLSRVDPGHFLSRNVEDSVTFFQSCPFKTHWIVDVSKLKQS